jgi:cubilin
MQCVSCKLFKDNFFICLLNSLDFSFHTDPSATGSGFRMEWVVEGCGGKLYHPSGTLSSPNYPKRYSHDLTCKWEITVDYGYKIEITLHDLDIETSRTCDFDSLIFSKDKTFNDTLPPMCQSHNNPTVFTSDGHQLFIKFESDESNSGRGFNLTYKRVLSDCGGKFSASAGMISTPNYPTTNYENKKTCEWNLVTDLSHTLTFQLTDFDLEQSENCTKDRLEIFDPVKLLWFGCGNQMPNQTTFKAHRNELLVRLISDADVNAKGFKGNFSNDCGSRIIVNDTGEFQYRKLTESPICIWTIVADDPAKKVALTFSYVSIFLDTIEGCLVKIEVFDGDSDEGPLRKSFCGSKTPPTLISYGDALTIKLNATSFAMASEFDVHYSVLDNGKSLNLSRNLVFYNSFQRVEEPTLLAPTGSLALQVFQKQPLSASLATGILRQAQETKFH